MIADQLRRIVIPFLMLTRCDLFLVSPGQKHLLANVGKTDNSSAIAIAELTGDTLIGNAGHKAVSGFGAGSI